MNAKEYDMTASGDRPGDALLVIDAQNGVFENAHERDAIVARIAALIEKARGASVPVIWVQHSADDLVIDSEAWQIVPELEPRDEDAVIRKVHGDSFEATDLEEVLAKIDAGHLIISGGQTDACVRSTLHGGFARGYHVTLVSDAHSTEDLSEWGAPPPEQVIAHTNLYWGFQTAAGRIGKVAPVDEVDFRR